MRVGWLCLSNGQSWLSADLLLHVLAWVVNQSLTPLPVTDPILRSRQAHEAKYLHELAGHAAYIVLEPWGVRFVGSEPRTAAPMEQSSAIAQVNQTMI